MRNSQRNEQLELSINVQDYQNIVNDSYNCQMDLINELGRKLYDLQQYTL